MHVFKRRKAPESTSKLNQPAANNLVERTAGSNGSNIAHLTHA